VTGRLFGWESPRPAAVMRIGLGAVLLWDALIHWPYVVELYSADGMPMPLFPGTAFAPPALPAEWAVVLFGLMVFSLGAVVAGWQTRLSLFTAFVLTGWFGLLDSAGTFKKYSVIALHLLLLLAFSRSQAVWSLDRRLDPQRRIRTQLSPRWPRLLMRVLLSSIYLGAVITKLRMPDFANGDVLTFSLLDERWGGNRLGMWLSTQPRLMILLSMGTILFEMAALFLLWVPKTRRAMLLLAFLFHLGIGVTMHVGIFSPLMIVALGAFLRESDLQLAMKPLVKLRRRTANTGSPDGFPKSPGASWRMRLWSSSLYLLSAAFFAAAGFGQQYYTDQSGVFQPEKSPPWRAVDEQTADDFLAPEPFRVADYFHRVEIGGRLGYRHLFGERERFRRGLSVYVMTRLIQRTVTLQLECVLIDPNGDEARRHRLELHPAYNYASFRFRTDVPNRPAGEYTILLIANGKEVARRRFTLVDAAEE